jgi:hypothetical protein
MRRRFALLLFAALALLAIDPVAVRVAVASRAVMHRFFTIFPDRLWYPDYPAFLEEVRTHTRPGDTIAILVPSMRWEAGYSYAYYRASYVLAGREVLPLVQPDDSAVPQNLAGAKFVAAWHRNVQDPSRRVVWAGRGGALLER